MATATDKRTMPPVYVTTARAAVNAAATKHEEARQAYADAGAVLNRAQDALQAALDRAAKKA